MEYLGEGSPLLVAARAWGNRSRLSIVPHARAPLTDCRAPYADWLARRGKRDRKRWPQLERRLIADHDVAFAVEDGRHALPALLDRIFAIERSGWKGREGTAILDDPRDLLFYTRLAERAAAEGALRIATLSVDGRIVAFEYGILGGDRLFLLKIGYDETFETLSIGHVLALMHIRHCCADPAIAWYDKLSNGMTPARYKLRFNDTLDTLYRVTLYGPSWRGTLLQARDRTRATAKRVRDRWRQRRTAR